MTAITSYLPLSTLPSISSAKPNFITKIIEIATKILAKYDLTVMSLANAFFAVRIPILYIEYFVIHAIKDTALKIIGNIIHFFADVLKGIKWFAELKIFSLANISTAIGKIGILSSLVKIPLLSFANGLVGAAHFFFGLEAVFQLSKGNLPFKEKVAAWLELISAIMQITLMILFFSGIASLPLILVFGTCTGSISVICFCLRNWSELPFARCQPKKL